MDHDLSRSGRAPRPAPPQGDDRMAMSAEQIRLFDASWRVATYLTVGRIYLRDNPLLREPLTPVKPRLLGRWGTSPRLSDADGGAP